jgi:hypothetical protein
MKKLILLMSISMLTYRLANAQAKSTDIKTINGKKYYIHKVEKGQSLYAIAKTYNMDVNSILAENDDAIDGLNAGQELKIPFYSLMTWKQHRMMQVEINNMIRCKAVRLSKYKMKLNPEFDDLVMYFQVHKYIHVL